MFPAPLRSVLPVLGLLAVWAPGVESVQVDPAGFEPGVLDSLAAAAEGAPLFSSHEPLELTLRSRIHHLVEERPEEDEVDGTLLVGRSDGGVDTLQVEVRARGNFRRQKRNCNFPPLRLDVPRSRVRGTAFEGQDKLKLVTPCQDDRDDYQTYVIQEYLAYRVYNLVTPVSYRVRPVRITYDDVDGQYPRRTRMGFLIEDDEAMAHRNRAFLSEWQQFHPGAADPGQLALMAMFQYMIGNTDWSQPFFHNVDMVRSWEGGRYLSVPYDFDHAGVVDARYAEPDPTLGTSSVRERVYRGFCLDGVDHAAQRTRFLALRGPVEALYREEGLLDEDALEETLAYYEDFFETLEDFRPYRRLILDACTPLPS